MAAMRFSPALLFLAKASISVLLLALVFTRVSPAAALTALLQMPIQSAGLVLAMYFAAHVIHAAKLKLLLPELTFFQSWRFTMIAVFYSTALPGQLAGEAVKTFRMVLAGTDTRRAVAATVIDKATNVFALLLLTALGLHQSAASFDPRLMMAVAALIVAVGLALFAAIVFRPPAWLGRFGSELMAWRQAEMTPGLLSQLLLLGLLYHCLSIAAFVVMGSALGIPLLPAAWAIIFGVLSFVLLLPLTVAGIGLRDASLTTLVVAFGGSAGPALALSLALLALNLCGAAVGLAFDLAGRDRR